MEELKDKNNKMSKFDPKSVVIVMISYYPKWYKGKMRSVKQTDKVRGDLALKSIQTAKNLGYQIVLVDGKSSRSFRSVISRIKNIKLIKRRSIKRSPAKRQAIKIACKLPGVKVVILTEPEKLSLIKDCLPFIAEPILSGNSDLVVPKRDLTLFKNTYPLYQYESETEGNKLYNEVLRAFNILPENMCDIDFFFGPRTFRNTKKVVKLFMRRFILEFKQDKSMEFYDPEDYSSSLYFPIILALKKGFKMTNVIVPFSYPLEQKQNEEKCAKSSFINKRKIQRLTLLMELVHFVSYLQKNPGSRLKPDDKN